mgnify:CR=1 FL=1|jgi:hypothetical protein
MRTLREFESSGEVGRMSSSKVASSFDTAFCTSRSALRSRARSKCFSMTVAEDAWCSATAAS